MLVIVNLMSRLSCYLLPKIDLLCSIFNTLLSGCIILFILLPVAYGLNPQKAITQYQHKNWSTEHGLPQTTASAIEQTPDGYLWIGTSEGIARFDGVQFKVFDKNNTPILNSNTICSMIKDHIGNLWVGTQGGLIKIKDNQFTAYNKEQGLPAGTPESLYEDHNGAIWFKIRELGLVRFKDGKVDIFPLKDANLNFYSKIICEDQNGNLLVGTVNGLLQLKDNQFINYSPLLPNNEVLAINRDNANTLWIAIKDKGIYRLKDNNIKLYAAQEGLTHNYVQALHTDRDGNLWIGTNEGLMRFVNERFNLYTVDEGLSDNSIIAFYEDYEGNLWVGTNVGGIDQFKDGKFTPYTLTEGLPSKTPKLIEDRDGNIWAISRKGQTAKLSGGIFIPAELDYSRILPRSLATTVNPSLNVQTLFLTDHQGRVWQATYGVGVTVSKDGVDTLYTINNGLTTNTVSLLYEDNAGTIWIGTFNGGLIAFNNGQFSYYGKREGLQSDIIRYLYGDQAGNLWIGTNGGGLSRLKDGKIYSYTRKEGLFDDVVYHILEDDQHNLWMSCNKGIFRVSIADLDAFDQGTNKTIKTIIYGRADGMKNPECVGGLNFALKSQDGRFWFATIEGIVMIDPNNIKLNRVRPPIKVEDIIIDGQIYQPQQFLTNQYLSLPANIKRLEFHYTALSFVTPEKVQFQCMLDGYDKDWVDVGAQRNIYYSNLAPGKYIFRVRACNNDGIWNNLKTALLFEISVPLWQRWWAYGLYILLITFIVYGVVQWRTRRLEHQNEILETKVNQRTAIIELQNQDLAKQKEELAKKNEELDKKNQQLEDKNEELLESNVRADRIFSTLAEALPGTILDGKYQLNEKIGAGGFGAVYRATHLVMKHAIAVKVFKPMPGNDSPRNLERFRLEAIAAARINHPNAVAILDSGISSEGIAYIVMELLKGHSLGQALQEKGMLPIKRTIEILLPICEVLAKAHGLGLVHRDIKPENIFLHQSDQGEVIKVVDFGIAKFAEERDSVEIKNLTTANKLIGTPNYMAPERIMLSVYDGQSDIYSLGVMFFEMLSGHPPFTNTAGPIMLMQHVRKRPPSILTYNPSIPDELAELIMRMLAKKPEERPNAKDLVTQLTNLLTLLKDTDKDSDDHKNSFKRDVPEQETLKFDSAISTSETEIKNIEINKEESEA